MQEEYIKDEQRNLKKEYLHAQEEVKRIQSVPLVIGQFLEAVDQNTGIVGSTTGSNYYVRILSTIDRELLKPSASVALHKHSNALVDVLPPEADSSISMLQPDEKPDVQYADIGGMDMQKQEIREAVELPLTHFELYKQIGIDPPRGVLMYGPVRNYFSFSFAFRLILELSPTARMRKNNVGKSRRPPHNGFFYPRRWFRIRSKVSRRRSTNGA